ncbi:indole-3-glycerol phosphate synthase TrpC [Aquisalimonas asiatica]|uniref:Indole-3-glycerol phosphate synthase n=1 Tax=Aquisalimonas asiatica TaxID=406100 RepID=A0A1H8TN09_9GAMM|nr:indole-3-glycerol phosphate synthase TrpC [Aquisalimonas asiatica]SEO92216.1 indole-3-glycerol phosphate synthase [Aquisalimonas asiatica]
MSDTPDVLKRILARKAEEVASNSQAMDVQSLRHEAGVGSEPRGFLRALRAEAEAGRAGVIAEVKKASPSKGLIREGFDPEAIARSYAAGGATCLSVLTDQDFFKGHNLDLRIARAACDLPVLRKDFIIDPFQVWESRVLGADCILLIAAALSDARLEELYRLARSIGMDVLVEVHTADELERALALEPELLGINNRDLHTFETDLQTTIRLLERVPAGTFLVTESGFSTREEVEYMLEQGVQGFLIGEAFMRASDPGERLHAMFR